MPYTNCKVHMEFVDTTALADSTFSSDDNASIGDAALLEEAAEAVYYAVPDLNSFLLDGSRTIMPDDIELPFISAEASEEDCTFESNPKLTMIFAEPHTSVGVTLSFVGNYPALLRIYWYDLAGEVLASEAFAPDSLEYFCNRQVVNYGKIILEFISTRLPGERVQCRGIKYGVELEWTGEKIQSATLNEEVDVTSATIPINSADISIIDTDNHFALSNQKGLWKSLQKKQKLTIVEEVGAKEVVCGVLYMDTWQSEENIVTFSLIDRIGVADKTKFYGGLIYVDTQAGTIIDSIMSSAGIEDYTVSEEIRAILLTGHLPICTHREALQQVVFACGAVASCSRTGSINIYLPDRYADATIGVERKFMGTTIEIDNYVSGVSIEYARYKLEEETEEIYNDVLPAGDTLIEFTEAYTDIAVTGGTLTASSVNYARVSMAEEGTCVIIGRKYARTDIKYTALVDTIDAGEEENVISYSGCTLFHAARVKEVAERILNYYQLRQIVTMRYLVDAEKVGDWVNIMDTKGGMVVSGLTSQSIDLTGGYIAKATSRGYSSVTVAYACTGEIYAGERGLI